MAVRLGFEPRLKESKSRVLPLHYQTIKSLYMIFHLLSIKKYQISLAAVIFDCYYLAISFSQLFKKISFTIKNISIQKYRHKKYIIFKKIWLANRHKKAPSLRGGHVFARRLRLLPQGYEQQSASVACWAASTLDGAGCTFEERKHLQQRSNHQCSR